MLYIAAIFGALLCVLPKNLLLCLGQQDIGAASLPPKLPFTPEDKVLKVSTAYLVSRARPYSYQFLLGS